MPQPDPSSLLNQGRAAVDAVVVPHGFEWVAEASGKGSGGPSASGYYTRGNRRLELHFRWGLGLVTYQVADARVGHEDYMRYLGHRVEAKFPGFGVDPLEGFTRLAEDLRNFCSDFLTGTGTSVSDAATAATARSATMAGHRPDLP